MGGREASTHFVILELMKNSIKFFRPVIAIGLKVLWFITRPKMFGSCVLVIHDNEVLLVTTTYWPGHGLPGGGIKKGETPLDAAFRETREEVGVELKDVKPLSPFVLYEDYKVDTIHPFYAYVDSKDYKLDKLEIDTAVWFSIDNLPQLNSGPARIVELYRNSLK